MNQVIRVDRGQSVQVTRQDGILRLQANLTRVGIFKYLQPDGTTRREYRPAEEVFSSKSLATYGGRPLTVGHRLDAVDASAWKDVAVGDVRDDAHPDGQYVRATVQVSDGSTVRRVDNKELIEVSCGYRCDMDETPGMYNGEPYDAVQRNIRLNHVALLPPNHGRAGNDVRLLLDSQVEAFVEQSDQPVKVTNHAGMDEKEKLAQELAALKAQLATAQGEAAAHKAMLDQARTDAKKAVEDLPAKIQARVALEAEAKRVFPEIKCDGKSDQEIEKEVVAKLQPALKLDDNAVHGAFVALTSAFDGGRAKVNAAIAQAKTDVQQNTQRTDSTEQGVSIVAKARAANYERSKTLYGMSDKKMRKLAMKLDQKNQVGR